jgi:hypothetical protein
MLTLFTTPKPFEGHFKTIQTNAIKSWLALRPKPEVILFGDEAGNAEIAAEFGLRHIPEVAVNEYGTPLVNDMFEKARQAAGNEYIGFVSADIMLMQDFVLALEKVPRRPFLMVGQRWDVHLDEAVDFDDPDWEAKLRDHVSKHGRLHPPTAVDYLIYNRDLYPDIPPFAMGRAGIDNWLIFEARYLKAHVIDATAVVTAVHQNHDTSFKAGEIVYEDGGEKRPQGVWHGPERARNLELVGGRDRLFTIEHADYVMTPEGVKPALGFRRLYFRFVTFPVVHRSVGFLRKPMHAFNKAVIGLRGLVGGRRG